MIQARNVDWSTLEQPFSQKISQNSKSSYTETIDCSTIPSDMKFLVIASGYVNVDGGSNHGYRMHIDYNSINISGDIWANAPTSTNTSVPGSAIALVTKVSGVDSVNIGFHNSGCTLREIRFNVCVVPLPS